MKAKDIKEAYKNLMYIVYKKKYLIPKPPTPPQGFYLSYANKSKSELSKLGLGNQNDLSTFHKELKEKINNNDESYLAFKQQNSKMRSEYDTLKQKYNEQYITPTKLISRPNVYNYFFIKACKESEKKLKSTDISSKWRELTSEQKEKLKEQLKVEIEKLRPRFQQYEDNHLIPSFFKQSRFNYYMILHRNLEDKDWYKKQLSNYQNLSQQQISKLDKDLNQFNQASKQRSQNFLKKWNLTLEELKHIKKICQLYQNYKNKKKENKILKNDEEMP